MIITIAIIIVINKILITFFLAALAPSGHETNHRVLDVRNAHVLQHGVHARCGVHQPRVGRQT